MKSIWQILKEEQEISILNISRLKSAYDFREQYLLDQDGDLFLTVDSLILLNNIVTGSQHTSLRTHNVKPAGFNKQYMEANEIEVALHGLVDDFND